MFGAAGRTQIPLGEVLHRTCRSFEDSAATVRGLVAFPCDFVPCVRGSFVLCGIVLLVCDFVAVVAIVR